MAGDSSPAKKPTRSSRAAAATQARDASMRDSPTSLSPPAAALKALKKLTSPPDAATTDPENEANEKASSRTDPENNSSATPSLRIQAPKARCASPRASGTHATSSSGPAAISPAGSGLSVPTSPADDGDGLDTPDGHGRGQAPSKRPRLLAEPSTPTASPPLFLEKTYEMLDKSSPQVACWSRAGDSFIVKNPVAFAEHVIPIYFKHRNFSSFVRQLNFYGFRKVRVVDPDVTGGVDPKDWWEFRHDKFQRGRKELLAEIKRRSLSSGSNGSASAANGVAAAGDAAPTATIDRAEIDELRAEVGTLREQIQTLNKHMFSVMQIMMTRTATPTPTAMAGGASGPHGLAFTAPSPHQGLLHRPHHHQHPHQLHYPPGPPSTPHGLHTYPFVGSLPPPHLMAGPGATAHRHDKPQQQPPRGQGAPASPAGGPGATYALRPIQSFAGAPAAYGYPMTPSSEAAMDWDAYSRHAFHAAQVAQAQAAAAAAAAATASKGASQPQPRLVRGDSAPPPSSVATPASSVPAVPGLKRARSQPKRTPSTEASASATTTSPSTSTLPATPVNSVENPEAAVRQLSMQVSQIRADLLQSILTRTLSFLRAQPAASASTTAPSPEIDATAAAIGHDIQQRLAQVNEAEAATHGRAVVAASETSHMYRVEMLKFVSKELPRAMSEAVEKRLPAPTKKALNRSLLALMVQKAQAALEAQMRVETASAAISPSNGSASCSSASTGQSSAK